MTPVEDQILRNLHRPAAEQAKAQGACWQCCIEAGCRATDKVFPRAWGFEFHAGCAKKMGVSGPHTERRTT